MSNLARRRFVCALGASALVFGPTGGRAESASAHATRTLAFDNLHTGEKSVIEYYARGTYVPQGLLSANRLLRDFRTGDVGTIDVGLLDVLHRLSVLTASHCPFQVISGYRSPATNEALRKHGSGVAKDSLHTQGRAIDLRLADVPLHVLRDAAQSMRAGGVGYYPDSAFVHVDTGRIRSW